jgi:GH35 family endo-1,4-beta-xylanase
MRSSLRTFCLVSLTAAWLASQVSAQTTLPGNMLALRSTGSGAGAWTLDRNGYVGTYINLPAPGNVTVSVNASGTASGGIDPHMNIVLADTRAGFDVASGTAAYQHTFDLPAGTYFLRTELSNDLEASSRALTIQDITVSGATVLNASNNSNALAAADTYVDKFRKGNVSIGLSGVAPGTPVDVRLKRHAFNFGTAIPNVFTDTYLIDNPPPGSTAAKFQQALADSRFNSLTPENAGKWASNEVTRDVQTVSYMDRIMTYAEEHDMGFRQHNLIWGRNPAGGVNQQPTWADNMAQNPTGIDAVSGNTNSVALRDEISERIDYYLGDRAHRYYEVDIYNESYHTGSNQNHSTNTYWDVYGASGIASIYKESKDAIEAAGADARVYVNEYNVLQNEGGDSFANWYVRHFETLQNAGRVAYGEDVVEGIGFQYYANAFGGGAHNPARIYAVMQNIAVQGLPMHLTEFGISSGTTDPTTQANILSEALRLVFGMPDATGFTMWGFWAGAVWSGAPNGVLYNSDWTIRPTGTAWNNSQNQWDTELALAVGADGTIDFDGFWGDYELTIGGQTYDLTLSKGQSLYSLPIAPGDYNGDGVVDVGDYLVWQKTVGSPTDLRADGNGDFEIDEEDFAVWHQHFGTVYSSGNGAATNVPEPNGALVTFLGALIAMGWNCSRRQGLLVFRQAQRAESE